MTQAQWDKEWALYLAWCEKRKQIPWLQQFASGVWKKM